LNWSELHTNDKVVFGGAVSGGLDSCTVTHWLAKKGIKVHCFTVDLGQPDESDISEVSTRMTECGAESAMIVPGQDELAKAGLKVIQAQSKYEGGYWNTTGIARPVTVEVILREFHTKEISVLFHGATGRGNDQVRFQLAANIINPEVQVYAPWRDPEFLEDFPGRQEMIDYCESHNLPIRPAQESRYSTDANFLGLTHEAGDLEDVSISPSFVEPGMGVWPWDAPDVPEYVTIEWKNGIPVSVNGEKLPLTDIFGLCNELAGRNGVGIGTHVVENRFVGIKSRGIYESPGMDLLGSSYEFLLQFVLDRRSREYYDDLSSLISKQIYQGYWLDSATRSALASIEVFSSLVSGKIQLKIYKGNIFFDTAEDTPEAMPYSLYTDDGSMEGIGSYDHVDAEGFINVLGVSARNVGNRQYKVDES